MAAKKTGTTKASARKKTTRKTKRAPRTRGRKTRCTPAMMNALCESVRNGNYLATAARANGLGVKTAYEWLSRGEGTDPDREASEPFITFARMMREAEAECEQRMITILLENAQGFDAPVEETVKERNAKGNLVIVKKTTRKKRMRDTRIVMNFLERRFPTRWGSRASVEISGPGGDAVQVSHTKDLDDLDISDPKVRAALETLVEASRGGDEE